MSNEYKFAGGFTVRQATPEDRELLKEWIAGDPEHSAKKIPAEFFYDEEPGVGCYLMSDETGPLFFFRTANTVRLDSQFGPSHTDEERHRNREGLIRGMDWLAYRSALAGASEIIFDSVNPPLIRLAVQQMGCDASPHELVRSLEPERAVLRASGAWQPPPQDSPKENS